jgi:hypothetical protein
MSTKYDYMTPGYQPLTAVLEAARDTASTEPIIKRMDDAGYKYDRFLSSRGNRRFTSKADKRQHLTFTSWAAVNAWLTERRKEAR